MGAAVTFSLCMMKLFKFMIDMKSCIVGKIAFTVNKNMEALAFCEDSSGTMCCFQQTKAVYLYSQ